MLQTMAESGHPEKWKYFNISARDFLILTKFGTCSTAPCVATFTENPAALYVPCTVVAATV